jgi:hypothetical protein
MGAFKSIPGTLLSIDNNSAALREVGSDVDQAR